MLADAALLLLLATVGILQRTHETTVIPAIMACQALAFYSLARSIDRLLTGATTLAIALAASFLTRGWIGAIPIMAGALLTFYPRSHHWRRKRWLPWIVLLTAALIMAWWIPATQGSEYWIRNWKIWNLSSFAGPDLPDMGRMRDLPWYLWPALAARPAGCLLARVDLRAAYLGAADAVDQLGPAAVRTGRAVRFGIRAAGRALRRAGRVLAADPATRRGEHAGLVRRHVLFADGGHGLAGLGRGELPMARPDVAQHRPPPPAEPSISWVAFGWRCWSRSAGWRWWSGASPQALWRGTVLSAGGLTATWILLVLLWQPAVDYARSYRIMSGQLAQALEQNLRPGECVRGSSWAAASAPRS